MTGPFKIGSKWNYNNLPEVYEIIEVTPHRIRLKHELTGTIVKTNIGLFKMHYRPVSEKLYG